MYNHAPKNYICPLCQIAQGQETEKGKQEDSVIFRDKLITIFVAAKWWRSNPAHVIIIPNSHFENLYDLSNNVGHHIFDYSKQVALALKETYHCAGVSTRQHNEPAGNQDAFHFHLHIFPRYHNDNLYINYKDTYWTTMAEREPYVAKLKTWFAKNN